uniref:Pentatricopeptide repeat-containing protein n=1 Tax=Rhizophora mucronata TaxID=61149 RepID=A0A2P2P2E9_RHIMU
MPGWGIWSSRWRAWSIEEELGLWVQKLRSLVRMRRSFWRWVLMVKAWICLSCLREVHLGRRDRGRFG